MENGIKTVSSEALAVAAGVKSPQLRKDLTYFGQFGTRGLGYDVDQLIQMISDLLGTNHLQPVVLIGVGNLGRALLSYRGFAKEGFGIVAAFDVVVKKQNDKRVEQDVYPMEKLKEFVSQNMVRMAILCVPPEEAQKVVNDLVEAGVTGLPWLLVQASLPLQFFWLPLFSSQLLLPGLWPPAAVSWQPTQPDISSGQRKLNLVVHHIL